MKDAVLDVHTMETRDEKRKEQHTWDPFYVVGQGAVERYWLASGIFVPQDNDGGQLQSSTQTLALSVNIMVKQSYRHVHELAVTMQSIGDSCIR